MIEVVTSIIPDSFEDLQFSMMQVKGHVSRVQLDVANGSYAPSSTWPYSTNEHFADLVSEEEGLPFWRELDVELDMLISEPEQELDEWVRTGITAAIIHIESTDKHSEIFKKLKTLGLEFGWAMKPNTPNDQLFNLIDKVGMPGFVQVMGNDKIGYHGVELDTRVYDKVRMIRDKYPELPIAVDIGVNQDTAPKLVEAGVTKLVSGSAILNAENPEEVIEYFQNL